MNSEEATNAADFFLREIPNIKTSEQQKAKKNIVKEELQLLCLSDNIQHEILETLQYIYGPDFNFNEASSYENIKSNLGKKFWLGQNNLIVKGGCNFSENKDEAENEQERMKHFALLRLESYGFHKNHCIEAFNYCGGSIEDSLYLLYNKYFNNEDNELDQHNDFTDKDLLELRLDEKSSLESIYEDSFYEKVQNSVWIFNLKLDYLIKLFHNVDQLPDKQIKQINNPKKREKCRNFLKGDCKYGDKCRFAHIIESTIIDPNSHLKNFQFELEIRFPIVSKYPYEPPLILLKTNAILPPLVNLHICKKLYNEAKVLAEDGIPSVYTIIELIKNDIEIINYLKNEINFLNPNVPLFSNKLTTINNKNIVPSHFKKGKTNRDNKKVYNLTELKKLNNELVKEYKLNTLKKSKYHSMLTNRKQLPAWALMNKILNNINNSQVIVISGETGCGKSTQIPQFILDDWINNYENNDKHLEIICTQPRRISAIGVAERIAEERCEKIGHTIGYQIRLENKLSQYTRLIFCTIGILLRRFETNPLLTTVSHIIVDEVHERSEENDFLLYLLKDLISIRKDIKIILMSATINAKIFSDYFYNAPILTIPGRTFPVEQLFLEDILDSIPYVLEENSEYCRKITLNNDLMENEIATYDLRCQPRPPDNIKDENLTLSQIIQRYSDKSIKTCKNIFFMNSNLINNDLIESILVWFVNGDHYYSRKGSILIFLPGIAEINSLYDQLIDHTIFGRRVSKFLILPLHSSLSNEEQALIFKKPKDDLQKIILSTNIAETSITIDDCIFVIDSGKMKEKHFDPNRNMESLETVWTTKANALQRKGRAGRVMTGLCIHLFTNYHYKYNMLGQPIPEICRVPLEQLILNIKSLENFYDKDTIIILSKFIEPPIEDNIISAIKRLQNIGALDDKNNITPLGHHLATLPVDVRIGKLMLYGTIFSCVDSAITIAACLSYKSPFIIPFGKKSEAYTNKMKFAIGNSDQITTLFAYKKWLSINKKSSVAGRNFANENFLSQKTLITLADIKLQFLEFLINIGFVSINLMGKQKSGDDRILELTGSMYNKNSENLSILSSILCAALYPNIVKILKPSKSYVMSAGGAIPKQLESKDLKFTSIQETVFIHPSSVNYLNGNFSTSYLIYQEKIRTSKVYIRDCTMVPLLPLILFSSYDLNIVVHNNCTFISLENGWIMVQVEEHKIAEMIKMIRKELFLLLEEKIKDPLMNLQYNNKSEKIIKTIYNLINLK